MYVSTQRDKWLLNRQLNVKKLDQQDLRYTIQYAAIMMGLGLPSHLSGWTGKSTDPGAAADDACLHFES